MISAKTLANFQNFEKFPTIQLKDQFEYHLILKTLQISLDT